VEEWKSGEGMVDKSEGEEEEKGRKEKEKKGKKRSK